MTCEIVGDALLRAPGCRSGIAETMAVEKIEPFRRAASETRQMVGPPAVECGGEQPRGSLDAGQQRPRPASWYGVRPLEKSPAGEVYLGTAGERLDGQLPALLELVPEAHEGARPDGRHDGELVARWGHALPLRLFRLP